MQIDGKSLFLYIVIIYGLKNIKLYFDIECLEKRVNNFWNKYL